MRNNVIALSSIYSKYLDLKFELLNNKKIIEYMYNKPISKVETEINSNNYDDDIKIIILSDDEKIIINNTMINILELHTEYTNKYYESKKNRTSELKIDLTKNEILIAEFLEKIATKYHNDFVYTFNWNFNIDGDDSNLLKKATVNFQDNHNYSFFGITTFKNHLIMFVIIYINNSNDHNIVIRQYMMYNMNINILILSEKSNIEEEIRHFIKKIKHTTDYTIYNQVVNKKIINKHNEVIINYIDDYKYNYIINTKNEKSKKNIDNINYTDDFYEKIIIKDSWTDENQDSELKISNNIFNKIINDRISYIPDKSKNELKAEKYMAKLFGESNNVYISNYNDKNTIESTSELKNILRNCKQSTINYSHYLQLDKLKNYKFLNKDNSKLIPGKTYIKYINICDINKNKNYKDHVHSGGVFLAGGIFFNGSFTKYKNNSDQKTEINPNKWSHLLVKKIPYPQDSELNNELDNIPEYSSHVFYIKISNFSIFYRYIK